MLSPALVLALEDAARQTLGNDFHVETAEPVGGGDINTAIRLNGAGSSLFGKLNSADHITMFEAEADGLHALSRCDAIRVPAVLGSGQAGGQSFLLLEWLDIEPLREAAVAQRAGEALAALHHCTHTTYGWPADNFIGSTLQHNAESINWPQFFITRRLQPQIEMAQAKGFGSNLKKCFEPIRNKFPALFLEYHPEASLLHGDLWSGNLGALPDGTPVLFDPACYFGDRETDLAMTELFGGLPLSFYAGYRQAWAPHPDYERRKPVYNLYHILNHLNLFGRSYLGQAERLAAQLARELGH